jgi:hypothetical protein
MEQIKTFTEIYEMGHPKHEHNNVGDFLECVGRLPKDNKELAKFIIFGEWDNLKFIKDMKLC